MPNSAASISERATFGSAAAIAAAEPGDSQAIADMMRLSTEGTNPYCRQRARDWLFQHCNVRVSDDAKQEVHHAAPAPTAHIR